MLEIMRNYLPSYAVHCLLNAGYDRVKSIIQMNTNEGPGNTLDQIESFILRNFSGDESCFPPVITKKPSGSNTFIFLPGHCCIIYDFIKQIKMQSLRKRSFKTNYQSNSKKKKLSVTKEGDHDEPLNDLNEISTDVRKRIVKWQRKQSCEKLQALKEHVDYKVICKLDKSNYPVVSVHCTLCDKTYQLYQKGDQDNKNNTVMISNWTKHIKNCFDETQKLKKHGKQMSLTMFMPESSSTSETNTDESDLDHAKCSESSKVQVFQIPLLYR